MVTYPRSSPRTSIQNAIHMPAPGNLPLPPEASAEFSISRLTGHKKALIVGIEYRDTWNVLSGSIPDANNIEKFIVEHYGFEQDNIVKLTDDNPEACPTKDEILLGLGWLVEGAQPNDSLLFYFSGHAKRFSESNEAHQLLEKVSGKVSEKSVDKVLCPVDATTSGYIENGDLQRILLKDLPLGCRLTIILDCCSPSQPLLLPYEYDEFASLDKVCFPRANKLPKRECSINCWPWPKSTPIYAPPEEPIVFPFHDVIILAGIRDCQSKRDIQTAEDSWEGALTHRLIKILTPKPHSRSYHKILHDLRTFMIEEANQIPRLGSGHPLDTSRLFLI